MKNLSHKKALNCYDGHELEKMKGYCLNSTIPSIKVYNAGNEERRLIKLNSSSCPYGALRAPYGFIVS